MRAQSQPRPEAALFVVVLELSSFAFSSSANRTILSCLWWGFFFSLLFFFGVATKRRAGGLAIRSFSVVEGLGKIVFYCRSSSCKEGRCRQQAVSLLPCSFKASRRVFKGRLGVSHRGSVMSTHRGRSLPTKGACNSMFSAGFVLLNCMDEVCMRVCLNTRLRGLVGGEMMKGCVRGQHDMWM